MWAFQSSTTKGKIMKIQAGDTVAYSANFIKFVGSHDKSLADARGQVVSIKEYGDNLKIAKIEWNKGIDLPEKVAVKNLAKVGTPAFYCG